MESDLSNDKELFRHLGLLSNEVIQVQKTLHTIDSQESRLRAALDELALDKEILMEQVGRLETMVKQAATSAVEDAERERERNESLESEKSSLRVQFTELEETLRTKEAAVRDLRDELTAKIEVLTEQVREKESQLQIRDAVLTDLKAAAGSLNRLVSNLSSNDPASVVLLDEMQEDPTRKSAAIDEIEKRMSAEIERLQNAVREKEAMLSAKSLEVEMTKQAMGSRIEELEKTLDSNKRRKNSQRLVSLLSDVGGKRFF
jgi:DNA repair exonuclease SbcCD ATPase subunit